MTEFQQKIIEFINTAENKKRYLCEFIDIIPVKTNQVYEWQVRGSILAKMVKSGIIKERMDSPRYGRKGRRNRQTIYYYL
jgi:hypothetical protein